MKIFKSIKWRLQIWYGLILVVVLAGFGFTAYQLEWGRQMRRIDDELQRRSNVLGVTLHPPPRGSEPRRLPFDRSLHEAPPADEPPGPPQRLPLEFRLPPQAAGLFDTNDLNGFYFAVRDREGKEIARSGNWPNHTIIREIRSGMIVNAAPRIGQPPAPFNRKNFRELFEFLPSGEKITVVFPSSPK
jgi:hypothetical protein